MSKIYLLNGFDEVVGSLEVKQLPRSVMVDELDLYVQCKDVEFDYEWANEQIGKRIPDLKVKSDELGDRNYMT